MKLWVLKCRLPKYRYIGFGCCVNAPPVRVRWKVRSTDFDHVKISHWIYRIFLNCSHFDGWSCTALLEVCKEGHCAVRINNRLFLQANYLNCKCFLWRHHLQINWPFNVYRYGHTLGGAVGLAMVADECKINKKYIDDGEWHVDIGGKSMCTCVCKLLYSSIGNLTFLRPILPYKITSVNRECK